MKHVLLSKYINDGRVAIDGGHAGVGGSIVNEIRGSGGAAQSEKSGVNRRIFKRRRKESVKFLTRFKKSIRTRGKKRVRPNEIFSDPLVILDPETGARELNYVIKLESSLDSRTFDEIRKSDVRALGHIRYLSAHGQYSEVRRHYPNVRVSEVASYLKEASKALAPSLQKGNIRKGVTPFSEWIGEGIKHPRSNKDSEKWAGTLRQRSQAVKQKTVEARLKDQRTLSTIAAEKDRKTILRLREMYKRNQLSTIRRNFPNVTDDDLVNHFGPNRLLPGRSRGDEVLHRYD